MTDEEQTDEAELLKLLGACASYSRPDEFQANHNRLIRYLTSYVLKDYIFKDKGEEE